MTLEFHWFCNNYKIGHVAKKIIIFDMLMTLEFTASFRFHLNIK